MPIDRNDLVGTAESRLDSWKEIAAYLNCSERTAKRWEKTRSLPVHRLPGGPGHVFAFRQEVLAWQASEPLLNESGDLSSEAEEMPTVFDAWQTQPSAGSSHGLDRLWEGRMRWWIYPAVTLVLFGITFTVSVLGRNPLRSAHPFTAMPHVPVPAARDLYLQGRFYWNKRTPEDLQLALRDFQSAIAIDPGYAAAYAGMADTYGLSTEFAAMAPESAYPRMLAAAERAIQLDPDLPEGHRAVAFASFYWNWDLDRSRREFARTIQLEGGQDATTYHWFSNVLQQGGDDKDVEEALAMSDKARELNPASQALLADRGLILLRLGRTVDAMQVWASLEHSDPAYLPPHWYRSAVLLNDQDPTGFLTELNQIAAITQSPDDLDHLHSCELAAKQDGIAGVRNVNADFLVNLARRDGRGYYRAALALDVASRSPEALTFLDLAFHHHDPAMPLLAHTREFHALANSERFLQLRTQSEAPFNQTQNHFPQIR